MISFLAGAQRQAVMLRRLPDYLTFIVMSPFSTIMFLAIVRSVGRDDLGINALIGVSIITTWQTALFTAGDSLALDRHLGIFELNLAAPISFFRMVLGRIVMAISFSFIPFGLNIGVAWLIFGTSVVEIADPGRGALVLLFTWFATIGAMMCMSAIFIMSGRSTALSNGLSYPLFLLAGIIVPTSFLPQWIQPLSYPIFMRWSAEGLRTAANGSDESIVPVLVALTVLGLLMLATSSWLLSILVDRMRQSGAVSRAI